MFEWRGAVHVLAGLPGIAARWLLAPRRKPDLRHLSGHILRDIGFDDGASRKRGR